MNEFLFVMLLIASDIISLAVRNATDSVGIMLYRQKNRHLQSSEKRVSVRTMVSLLILIETGSNAMQSSWPSLRMKDF